MATFYGVRAKRVRRESRARAESGPRDEIRRSRGECATDGM